MNTSDKGLSLIRQFEGFSSKPYLCPANKWTIGFGSTYHIDGTPVTEHDAPVTIAQALDLLKATLMRYESEVTRSVKVTLTQNEFDALVCLAYNIGCTNFRTSTLLRKLNEGNYGAAAEQFDRWNQGGGRVLLGLVKRRAAEKALFLGQV